MKAAIYIRVSTDEQANEGFSIEAQKRRLLAYADSQDWEIAEVYIDDGWSAKDLKRPEMQRMMKDVSNKLFDVVLVYKLDRMTRSSTDCDQLLKLLRPIQSSSNPVQSHLKPEQQQEDFSFVLWLI